MNIKEILEVTGGELINGDETLIIEDFSKDTRTIKQGDLYVGIKGEKFDGNEYYKIAYENGAIATILDSKTLDEEELKKYSNVILVEDSIKALQDLAKHKREKYDIPVIAVTGSVGKTSTKDMIASVLSRKYNVLKTQGNNNNHIGLPLTILKLKDHNALVVEMGMNHLGEISVLTNIAKPTMCVITNVGTSHIGNLGSRENILKAKLEILEGLKEGGEVIINNDNDLLYNWAKENKDNYNVKTYGLEHISDYMAYNLETSESMSTYKIKLGEIETQVKVPVPGIPFVFNSLCGIAVGKALNMKNEEIIKGIQNLELTKKRMEIKKTKEGVTIINDSYNASLDSVKPALEQLNRAKGNKKIAVLGDMLELGEFTKELHEKVGEEVVKNNIDILITVGNAAKYIAEKARELQMKEIYSFDTTKEATKKIKELQEEGDVILFKASNSMNFSEIVGDLI